MRKDILTTIVLKFVFLTTSFAQSIIIARLLGPEGRGEIAIYMALFNITFDFLNLGIRQSTAFYMGKKDWSINRLYPIQILSLKLSSLLIAIVLLFYFYFKNDFELFMYLAIIFITPFKLYTNYTSSYALTNRWINKINNNTLINCTLTLTFNFIFYYILDFKAIEYFFIALIIGNVVSALYNYLWVNKLIKKIEFTKIKNKELFTIIKKGITYSLPLLVFGLNFKIDIFILEHYRSPTSVGIYTIGAQFAELIWQIPAVLNLIIFSYSISTKNNQKFSNDLLKKAGVIMLWLLPMVCLFGLLGNYLIPLFYGSEYQESSTVFQILLPGVYAIVSFNLLNGDLAARGKPLIAFYIFSISAIINIIMNLILIPKYGFIGAASTSSLTYILGTLFFLFIYKKIINQNENNKTVHLF